jgi:hypothetical protein
MRSVRRLLLLLLPLFLPAAVAAQVGVTTDIISGRVTGPAGQPVAGAQIEAVSAETEVRRTAVTRADGRYTLVFPDGGGRYRVRASALGFAAATLNVAREADEDVLSANFRLGEEAIAIAGVEARASRTPPPTRGETGGQERFLPSDVVNRLPLEDNDPARLATLSPGVVAVGNADSTEARQAFSVAGQRASLNQVTLDGTTFASALTGGQAGGGSPLSLPQEGLRGTQVVTNTYDVSRGQFTGGQVSMTTRGGTNNRSGSFSWSLRDPALQAGAGRPSWGGGFTQNRFSGGFGGPVVKDKLFYYLSFAAQRRTDDLYSLTPSDPDVVTGLGVSPDSVTRFLSLLQSRYGVTGRTGDFSRTNDALTLLGRVDYTLTQQHTLALRGHLSRSGQDNARIGFLETRENGGEADTDGKGAIATFTSRLGGSVVNELRASFNDDRREQVAYDQVPEGRVRVSSELPGGERGVSTLVFGGERSLPTNTRETTLELSEELSFLYRDQHRLKLGGLFNHTSFEQQVTNNRLGSFEFNSLEDFAAGRPARFTRSLSPRVTEGAGLNAAVYLGDTWRPTQRLQLSFGLRGEASRFDDRPAFNPDVLEDFGRRTDRVPSEVHVSPRAGFSLRLNEQGAPLKLVRGGFGEFRGRAPFSLFATALDQTGLSTGESQLECVGDAVPVPNWSAYESDPNSIPTACANGASGTPTSVRLPTVTVFEEDFSAPRSWKASLGFQTQLRPRVSASIDVTRTWGLSLYGVRDLNLDLAGATTLPSEANRPFFGDPAAVVTATGAVPLEGSRLKEGYAQVFEVGSNLESRTTQVSVGLNGLLLTRLLFSASYTFTRSTDQSSFSSGSPFFGFSQVPVAGNPNQPEWATSDLERRHSLVATLGWQPSQTVELTLIGRATSGMPFTPLVGGDINGDGARNDRAFVFDPASAYDPALAAGMARLLDNASGRVADCLRSQLGRIAERNACRGPWNTTVDVRSTLKPSLPGALGPAAERVARRQQRGRGAGPAAARAERPARMGEPRLRARRGAAVPARLRPRHAALHLRGQRALRRHPLAPRLRLALPGAADRARECGAPAAAGDRRAGGHRLRRGGRRRARPARRRVRAPGGGRLRRRRDAGARAPRPALGHPPAARHAGAHPRAGGARRDHRRLAEGEERPHPRGDPGGGHPGGGRGAAGPGRHLPAHRAAAERGAAEHLGRAGGRAQGAHPRAVAEGAGRAPQPAGRLRRRPARRPPAGRPSARQPSRGRAHHAAPAIALNGAFGRWKRGAPPALSPAGRFVPRRHASTDLLARSQQ